MYGHLPELGVEQSQAPWGLRLTQFEEPSEVHN